MSEVLPNKVMVPEEVPLVPSLSLGDDERELLLEQIRTNLDLIGATLIAHYYVDEYIQDLAEETGGFVGDSLEMARFGRDCESDKLIIAGVRFMGETAKILSCLLYTSPSPRDVHLSRMPSSA